MHKHKFSFCLANDVTIIERLLDSLLALSLCLADSLSSYEFALLQAGLIQPKHSIDSNFIERSLYVPRENVVRNCGYGVEYKLHARVGTGQKRYRPRWYASVVVLEVKQACTSQTV